MRNLLRKFRIETLKIRREILTKHQNNVSDRMIHIIKTSPIYNSKQSKEKNSLPSKSKGTNQVI